MMRQFALLFAALVLGTSIATAQDTVESTAQNADVVIWGGPIYTADDAMPEAEAVAIRGGRFVYVGSRVGAEAMVGNATTVMSLDGAALFPGFTDAHAHMSGIGDRELTLNLEGTASIEDMKQTLLAWSSDHGVPLLYGRGWIETHWPEARFPTRWDIDAVLPDVPVILTRADGHALVANSKALEMAGVDSQTEAPYGGDILKNALGEPTGMFIDAAMSLLQGLAPEQTEADLDRQLTVASDVYARYGWTGMHNMSVPWTHVEALEMLSGTGDVKIRVYNSIEPGDADKLFVGGQRKSENGHIVTRAIKLYMDGALGSRGAALLEPYADAATSGLLLTTKEETLPLLRKAISLGVQVNMHAIGDRGNRLLLDWYEEVMEEIPSVERAIAEPRWRDEHTQIVSPDDIPRYKALGIISSMQPSHAIGDLHFAPDRLGEDRLVGAYAWQSFIDSGVIVAGGSDAPVERGDPLIEFYAAIYRHDLAGFQGDNWHAEEAVSRSDALKMFTLWPATASFAEDELGSISVGKQADLTAFSIDLMKADPAAIPKANAVMTMVGGEVIYLKE
ncbi:amidohydrolase [Kordiimonas sp.]|uniref:amidohydrolase n=1 Tax=Kordiimonas sp. TaxID=1970157 RepID=UPI003A8FFED8